MRGRKRPGQFRRTDRSDRTRQPENCVTRLPSTNVESDPLIDAFVERNLLSGIFGLNTLSSSRIPPKHQCFHLDATNATEQSKEQQSKEHKGSDRAARRRDIISADQLDQDESGPCYEDHVSHRAAGLGSAGRWTT